VAARANPHLTCAVKSVSVIGKQLRASGACSYGARHVPAHWSWAYRSADLDGIACGSFGFAHGGGQYALLPRAPRGVSGHPPSPAMPGVLTSTFTVAARYQGRSAHASLKLTTRTPNSRVLCGAPPKIVNQPLGPGSEPACTWSSGTGPSLSNGMLRAGDSIDCSGLGNCEWHSAQRYMQNAYLVAGSTFTCPGGYVGFLGFQVAYYVSPDHGAQEECSGGASRASMFPVSPQWGPNWLFVSVVIDLFQNNQPVIDSVKASDWQKLLKQSNGTIDACGALRG
jgi:hypothetical protein